MAAKTSTKTTTKRNTKRPPAETTTTTTTATNGETVERLPTSDEIARRAFELFLARGRTHGRAQEDWLTAERELRERYKLS